MSATEKSNKVPRIQIDSLTFNSGDSIRLDGGEIVLVVGPNNAGKSVLLREIEQKLAQRAIATVVLRDLTMASFGTLEEFEAWAIRRGRINQTSNGVQLFIANNSVWLGQQLKSLWENRAAIGLHFMANQFCDRLTTEGRLQAANPTGLLSFTRQPPTHPLHHLYLDVDLEKDVSRIFRRAFDSDLVVNRLGGNQVTLHVGTRPDLKPSENVTSVAYARAVESLPGLAEQGDGMRSFAGALLHVLTGDPDIVIIDEPEAFLHPAQARLLGHILVKDIRPNRQLFLATHSGDLLRGAISAAAAKLRVLRICREGSSNRIHELDHNGISTLWRDPLLRQSNALDGVFHSQTVVCEADGDCRFFSAVMDAVWAQLRSDPIPDVMFTHCGGKDRMPVLIAALRALNVPVKAVSDFDVLREENPLRRIIETLGYDWAEVSADWSSVKKAIDQKKPELKTDEVKTEIAKALDGVEATVFPQNAGEAIRDILRKSSPWSIAKLTGKSYLPSGDPTEALNRLLKKFRQFGLHVIENGELESFDRSIGRHGPEWVNQVVQKDLANDPNLRDAREFVTRLLA